MNESTTGNKFNTSILNTKLYRFISNNKLFYEQYYELFNINCNTI